MADRSSSKVAIFLTRSSEPLTRSQVAEYLGVSVSTVRRMEGSELHPTIDARGVHRFDPEEVIKAAESVRRPASPPRPASEPLSPGELAAEVFERFERRYSLSEIVRDLRIQPRKVRTLYHEWRTSLERVERMRKDPAPALAIQAHTDSPKRVDQLLAELPDGQPTRISAALCSTRLWSKEFKQKVPIYDELGGFITHGPLEPTDIHERFGQGELRLTAYSLTEKRVLWEIARYM